LACITKQSKNLSHQDLSNNKFSGPQPSLGAPFLQYLNLSMNSFDGDVVAQLFFSQEPENLTVLDLSHNNFNGTLPDMSLFSSSLQQLDLSDNLFDSQEVPSWLLGFHQLQTL